MYRIYRYENKQETPYRHLYMNRKAVPYEDRAEPKERERRMDESLYRTRRTVKDTILCNDFSYFCTFTFSPDKVDDRTDYPALSKALRKFFNNYKTREFPSFKYMLIPEPHKDGAIHFHGVVNTLYGLCTPLYIYKRICDGFSQKFPNRKHYLDWPAFSERFGYFSCSKIRDCEKCATYVSKYITKDLAVWGKNQQLVMKSKGLKKPELVYSTDDGRDRLWIPPNDCDNEYCQAAWATEEYTARYWRGWWNPPAHEIIDWEDLWKYKQWPDFNNVTGCEPPAIEQMRFDATKQKKG